MFQWVIEDSGALLADEIMAKDALMLGQLGIDSHPILHFYEWALPSLTYGYFINPEKYLDLKAINQLGIQCARRPTGGGIIFHLSDFSFSILLPASHPRLSCNTLENYALINKKVAKAINQMTKNLIHPQLLPLEASADHFCQNFCMSKPTMYDLIVQGKKIGGAAQRRTKKGLLHQASLFLFHPPYELLRQIVLKNYSLAVEAMEKNSFSFFPHFPLSQDLKEMSDQIKKQIHQTIFEI